MKLHGSLTSPFSRSCMVTAIECGLASKVQLKLANLTATKADVELEKLSPLAKVPTLEIAPGNALYDSRVIMEYFCHISGHETLLPREGNAHFAVLKLVSLAMGLGDAAIAMRYETTVRPPDKFWAEFNERQNRRVEACLVELETRSLGGLREFTIGSIAVASMLAYLDFREMCQGWRKRHEALAAWLDEVSTRQSFLSTLPQG